MQDKTQQIFRDAPVPKAVLTNVIPSKYAYGSCIQSCGYIFYWSD